MSIANGLTTSGFTVYLKIVSKYGHPINRPKPFYQLGIKGGARRGHVPITLPAEKTGIRSLRFG